MEIQGHDIVRSQVGVLWRDYYKWPMSGWKADPPPMWLVKFLVRGLEHVRRPFMIIDHTGLMREVVSVVNVRTQLIRPRDRRVFVVYTYMEGTEERASWGEILFLDAGPRIPTLEPYNLPMWWLKKKEQWWPRKNK